MGRAFALSRAPGGEITFQLPFTLHAHTIGRRWFGECLLSVLLWGKSEADQPQWLKIHKWKGQTSQLTVRIWVPNNHIVTFDTGAFASSKSKNCLMWLFCFKKWVVLVSRKLVVGWWRQFSSESYWEHILMFFIFSSTSCLILIHILLKNMKVW